MAKKNAPSATEDQRRAWGFYGSPQLPPDNAPKPGAKTGFSIMGKQVGEVRYVVGWMADQMVRMGWRLIVDGSQKWSLTLPDNGGTVRSNPEATDVSAADHPANASRRVLEAIDWNTRTVREVTTNLFVAGELDYVYASDKKWRIVSVIRSDRDDLIEKSQFHVRGIWPHPADPEAADAPLFGVLSILDDMHWLNQLSRSQSANRVAMRGIIGLADSWKIAGREDSSSEEFVTALTDALSRSMEDPTDVSPVVLTGALPLVKPEKGGMTGLSWTIPNFPYDDKIDEKMKGLVERLAYGLPIPPEILLGLQAQSKATAFQVEGATYRAHIEPVALLVSHIATQVLEKFIPDQKIAVEPDPTAILARRNSVQDTFEAWDRQLVSDSYVRGVLGIAEDAEPSDEERARRAAKDAEPAPTDPSNDAAGEGPVVAAARMPGDDPHATPASELFDSVESERLSSMLHSIDQNLLSELVGAAHGAVSRTHERLGARVRSIPSLRKSFDPDISNEQLGRDNAEAILNALGTDGIKIVRAAIDPTLKWWTKRLRLAMESVSEIVEEGGVEVDWPIDSANASISSLFRVLTAAVTGQPLEPGEAITAAAKVPGLNESDLRTVLDLTNGTGEPGIAMGTASRLALLGAGVSVVGHRWQWAPGRKGQTFDPHKARDHAAVFNPEGFVGDNSAEWGALPGQGVNGRYCMCTTRWLLRGAKGKFLKEQPGEVGNTQS